MKGLYLLLVMILIVIASCTKAPVRPEVKPPEIKVEVKPAIKCDDPKPVDKIRLKPFKWTVINQQDVDGSTVSWISLTPEGYQAFITDMGLIKQQIDQLKAQIRYYAGCVKSATDQQPPVTLPNTPLPATPKFKPEPHKPSIDPKSIAKGQ